MDTGHLGAKIDGKVITSDELNQWKKKRIRNVVQKLALRDIPDRQTLKIACWHLSS